MNHTTAQKAIQAYLQNLPKPKNIRLITDWLPQVLGESSAALTPTMLRYLRDLGRIWLIGMVYRAMQPGCKFEFCPVLEGAQGLRKSLLIRVLAGDDFVSTLSPKKDYTRKEQFDLLGAWCVELAYEKNTDLANAKHLITSRHVAGKLVSRDGYNSLPLSCLFAMTTNDSAYRDETSGSRTLWPIPVRNPIDTAWLAIHRDALFAQAYALYQAATPATPLTLQRPPAAQFFNEHFTPF